MKPPAWNESEILAAAQDLIVEEQNRFMKAPHTREEAEAHNERVEFCQRQILELVAILKRKAGNQSSYLRPTADRRRRPS